MKPPIGLGDRADVQKRVVLYAGFLGSVRDDSFRRAADRDDRPGHRIDFLGGSPATKT